MMTLKQKEVYIQVSFERYKGKLVMNCFFHYLNLEWPIVYISNNFQMKIAFQFRKIIFVLANIGDPDEMPHYAAFHLGLH